MASSSSSTKLIPEGYTFLNPRILISKKAEKGFRELMEKLDKRDPDAFEMYIYNDFFNYAQLDLWDKELSKIHSKIVKKEWAEAFYLLEALTIFADLAALSWPMVDDSEHSEVSNKVYGACFIAVLRALKKGDQLDVEHFPNLETVLKLGAEWGQAMASMGCDSPYYIVLKGIGRSLFKDKSNESVELEKARVEEWINGLPADDQKEIRQVMKEQEEEDEDEDEEEIEEDKKPWFGTSKKEADEDYDDEDFRMSRTWKEYKGYLQTVPDKPLRGPPQWDLSKWSQAQKAEFSFDQYA